jgi:VIT1/CCC1 family predicted Fe2+/Mn2+ transporter
MPHAENHRSQDIGWLRAAVLGANDGIVSTASLIIGVAAAGAASSDIMLAGIAGLVAGAMSMAAGEYVSVSSQADAEKADLEIEKTSLAENFELEKLELASIYQDRGLDPELSVKVAQQLMDHDALAAHARDDIGIAEHSPARPLQAAISSGIAFTAGAALPLIAAWLSAPARLLLVVALVSLLSLTTLGVVAAKAGGAPITRAAFRVTFWGALAMLVTALVGNLFDVVV